MRAADRKCIIKERFYTHCAGDVRPDTVIREREPTGGAEADSVVPVTILLGQPTPGRRRYPWLCGWL